MTWHHNGGCCVEHELYTYRELTQEDAGSQQPHVGGAELQVAACGGQQERHAQDLHRIAGVGPATHQQQQPVERAKT